MITLATVVLANLIALAPATSQGPPPEIRARLDGFVQALSSGSAETFEQFAARAFAPELLASRSAAERKRMLEQVHGEFGRLKITSETADAPGAFSLGFEGGKGGRGQLTVTIEPSAPFRITRIAIMAGGDNGPAQDKSPAPPINGAMTPAQLSTALDSYLAARSAAGEFAGVVLIAKDGKVLFERGYGPADRQRNTPIQPALRFNVASIGKAFTKVAVGQLVAHGKLALTDTIAMRLPDHSNKEALGATIEQLLTHTGGVADFFGPDFDAAPKEGFASNADYYRFVASRPLTAAPGLRKQYCNGCYLVLGEIIAKVSGMPYESYIAEHVFKPAGMTRAGFLSYHDPEVAPPYTRRRGDGVTPASAFGLHGRRGNAAGGSFATAADLLAFDNAVREGRLLNPRMTNWYFDAPDDASGRVRAGIGIAGGAPGANAVIESEGAWTVVVAGNIDPPNAVSVGVAIQQALRR